MRGASSASFFRNGDVCDVCATLQAPGLDKEGIPVQALTRYDDCDYDEKQLGGTELDSLFLNLSNDRFEQAPVLAKASVKHKSQPRAIVPGSDGDAADSDRDFDSERYADDCVQKCIS